MTLVYLLGLRFLKARIGISEQKERRCHDFPPLLEGTGSLTKA